MKPRHFALLATAMFASTVSARADVRNDVMAGMARCASVVDNRAWLDCLYGAAQPMRALLGLPPAPQARIAPPLPAASAPATGQEFGMDTPPPAPVRATANRIHDRVTALQFDASGYFTITLANGQVWQQTPGDTTIAHWPKPAATYVADVTHGALGSYNLRVAGDGGSYKVRRVR